tara:strand:- start:167 stop:514 length:348 start_codon:yes stop_codon:yes gene_type:complete
MGYRSQVVLAVGPERVGYFLALLSTNKAAFRLFQQGLEGGEKDYAETGDLLMVWDDIKWYESFECVGLFQSFMDACEEGGWEDEFRFVRVGEDGDDVVILGRYTDDINVSRAITY